ncbi:type 1 glutamine amidotransferase domain-containing protein [Gulosibacter bifidus]|uniref:Type 1 glutamine amidotransferase domain-containing protein n=1 Tax=Gulosibacter bifidus TaxID=272239 RepID=A0ABW5RF56_9MICO|nr:type 1 glutamine amidotransferase domain-containing protein [Gulosibacter bifidus]
MTNSTKKIAFLVAAAGVEEIELTSPWQAMLDAGFTPALLSPEVGEVQAFNHLDRAGTFPVDVAVADAALEDYAALVLPGGVVNPDSLRCNADAVHFVREFVAVGKPVAAICHAPAVLIEADQVSGRMVTSWPSIRTDLNNAGAIVVDEPVVVDGNLITSRKPDDLQAFNTAIIEAVRGA